MDGLRMGDYVLLHPANLPRLTYCGEGAWGLNILVSTPSKAHRRNLRAHLSFFQLLPCDYVQSGQVKDRGETVKNGSEVSLRHVHTGKNLMASASEEGLKFTLGEGPQTWLRLQSYTEAVGATLRYSNPVSILYPISSVPHYLSLTTLDDISYSVQGSVRPDLVLLQLQPRCTSLRTHYPLRLRHRELALLLVEHEGKPKLAPWDDTAYWTWEPVQEMVLAPVETGEWYYLRNCASGRYLSSTLQLISQPDLSCALFLGSVGAGEITLETRDRRSLGQGPNTRLYYQKSFTTFYELESKLEVDLLMVGLPAQAFVMEPVSAPMADFIRAVGDLCECLTDPSVLSGKDAAISLVQRVSSGLNCEGNERATKQSMALGAGLVDAGLDPRGPWASGELFRSLLALLQLLIKGNPKAAQRAANSLSHLQRILDLGLESACLLGVIFKEASLPTDSLGQMCRNWIQKLEPVSDTNVVLQTHLLKLIRRLGEVKKSPVRIAQAEILLAAPRLLSVCKMKERTCVQLHGRVPIAVVELSVEYQLYVYHALRLLVLACNGNHQPGLATLTGLGFTPELLLEQQVNAETPLLLRAAFVRLNTALVCEPAGSSLALRKLFNLVFTPAEVARGPARTRFTGPVAAAFRLSQDFWRESLTNASSLAISRLIIANLEQVLCVAQQGLATPTYLNCIWPEILNSALATIGQEERFSEGPAEALRKLRKNGQLDEKYQKAVLEWVLRVTKSFRKAELGERALAAVSAGMLAAAQRHKGWLFTTHSDGPEIEEVLLKTLFCAQQPSRSAICSAVEELRVIVLSDPIAATLDHIVVLETEVETRLWASLQLECQHFRTALLSNSPVKQSLTALLDMLHIQAFTSTAEFQKAQRMSWSLGLLDLLAQIREDQENQHLAWMVALQCIRGSKLAGTRFLRLATWDSMSIELPAFGLLLREMTGLQYLGADESSSVDEVLNIAITLPYHRARRYLDFLSFLQVRADLQLLTAYRLRDMLERGSHVKAELLQLLALSCSNSTAAECTRTWFNIPEPSAEDWTLAQSWTAVQAALFASENLLSSIEFRLEPLRNSEHPCYSALPALAKAGLYSKVWPRSTPALPYRALFQDTSKHAYLDLWNALLSESVPGLETGLLVTLTSSLNGSKAIGDLGSILAVLYEKLQYLETSNPDLVFTRLLAVLSNLIPDRFSHQPAHVEPPDQLAQLLSEAKAKIINTDSIYRTMARKLLQLDYFTRSADGRKRFTAAIRHILIQSDASTKELLFHLFKEICVFDRQELEEDRALNSVIWLESGLIESALEGVRQGSCRVITSLELLVEATQDQLPAFQSQLLVLFQPFSFDVFCLLKATLEQILVSFQREETPDQLIYYTAELLITLLENCCEGSHDAFQRYFLSQSHSQGSINIVQQVSAFVIALLDCWRGTKEQESMLGQALEVLVNFVTGPCLPVQQELISNICLLKGLMKTLKQVEGASVSMALVRARLSVSRLLNTLVEGDDKGREGLVGAIDLDLLLQAIKRVYNSCIAGKEREIALGTLKDEETLMRVEFAFQLYTFLLELRETAPSMSQLVVLTEVQHTARVRIRAWLEEHIFPQRYSEGSCFQYFAAHTSYVEITRDSLLTSLFFRIPVQCSFLSTATKELLVSKDRSDRQDDLQRVLLEVPRLEAEMTHQQRLSRWPWLKVVTRLVGPLDTLTMLLIVLVNLLLLVDERRESLFALRNQEGLMSTAIEVLAVAVWIAAIAHYVVYLIEFYPRVTVESGRMQSLSFQLYPLIPHNDSLLMQPWVEMAQQTWVRHLPSCLRSLLKLFFSPECFTKLVLLITAIVAVAYPFFFPFLLLWFLPSYAALRHILQAITMNKNQLILTGVFCLLVVLMFTEVYFIKFSDYFAELNVRKAQYNTYCSNLGQCFVTVLDWGVRMGGGIGEAMAGLLEGGTTYSDRLPLDLFYFIIINIIILKIVFGIILDALGGLREARWASERDMYEKCFICRSTRNQLELHGGGWTHHILFKHSLFAYVAYAIYVGNRDKKNCSGMELYVKALVAKADPAFFPSDFQADARL